MNFLWLVVAGLVLFAVLRLRRIRTVRRSREARLAAARQLAGQHGIDALGIANATKVFGDRIGAKVLYALCRRQDWGAVYLVDHVTTEGSGDNRKTVLRIECAIVLDAGEMPEFELSRQRFLDRLGPLSRRLGRDRHVRLEGALALPDGWQLVAPEAPRVRALFSGGLGYVLTRLGAVDIAARGNKLLYSIRGDDPWTGADLSRFLHGAAGVGEAVVAAVRAPS